MTNLDKLKFNLQERQFPYFSDDELQMLLDNYTDINMASYMGCMMKASNDSLELDGVKIPSNAEYWKELGAQFKALVGDNSTAVGYKTSASRADGS